jgi:hypothetical protein
MGTFRPATPQQLRVIKESVYAACQELQKIGSNIFKPKRASGSKRITSFAPRQWLLPGDAICREFLNRHRRQISDALSKGDGHFFVRFGRILDHNLSFIEENRLYVPPLIKQFVVGHWAERCDGLPEFCYLTPSDISIVCLERLGYEISEAAIEKMRQRLKLKAFRGRKLHSKPVFAKDGSTKLIFPELDK